MIVTEVRAKSILSKSKVADYTVNPYVGCEHGCTYCYARFMKRFTGHREAWGDFIDVKVNAPLLLGCEIERKRRGRVWISGICDPYQPIEEKYELTRKCLNIFLRYNWPLTIQTKSPLVLRDKNLLKAFTNVEVGFTISTFDEDIRRIFEPNAPHIKERIKALEKLHSLGITTFVMIAPLLPGAEALVSYLKEKVNYVLIDKMNYHYADGVYRKYGLELALTDKFFTQKKLAIMKSLEKEGVPYQILF